MAQILASLTDINGFLPDDKAHLSDGEDGQYQIDASRVIKGNLAGVFTPVTLKGWDAPSNTPALIRGIAGRLIAAKYYSKLYSEDEPDGSTYAQNLYNEAVGMLAQIREGLLLVVDDNQVPIEDNQLSLTDAVFEPNDSTIGPIFSIGMEFG